MSPESAAMLYAKEAFYAWDLMPIPNEPVQLELPLEEPDGEA